MSFRGGMNEFVRQAARMQRKIEARREELKSDEFEASAGNDRVKAKVNGGLELVALDIDPKLIEEEGLEMTQDLVVAAANAALAKARESVDAEIQKVSGGLKIPGLG
jgi:nucleoid-associated protein EbfC